MDPSPLPVPLEMGGYDWAVLRGVYAFGGCAHLIRTPNYRVSRLPAVSPRNAESLLRPEIRLMWVCGVRPVLFILKYLQRYSGPTVDHCMWYLLSPLVFIHATTSQMRRWGFLLSLGSSSPSLSGHWTEVFFTLSLQLSFLGVVWEVNVNPSGFLLTSPGEY